MLIGVPKEIKNNENRIAITPPNVGELVKRGHQVMIQKNAADAIDFTNEDYLAAGAELVETPEEIFRRADMIVKVKEPQPNECRMLREGQILFTYLHLAPDRQQTDLLLESGCVAIAYETVTDNAGALPLLRPMSQVAGRMSIQAGAHSLEKHQGGRGVLLGGVPGVERASVAIIGGGIVGTEAAKMAIGLGAKVTILDLSLNRLDELDDQFGSQLNTLYSSRHNLEACVYNADLVIGAVLIPGASAPKLVTHEMLANMRKGAVLVDVAIDQGGCFETSKPTTHAEPTYVVDDVIHYCVANMPGAVPRTSTIALSNATFPFVKAIADRGYVEAVKADRHLLNGVNVAFGKVTHAAVAEAHNMTYENPVNFFSKVVG